MNADFQSTIIHSEKFDSFSIQVQSWKKRRLQIGLKPHRRKYRVRRRGKRVINSSFVAECPPGNAYKVGPNARNRNRGREKKEERRKKKLGSLFISVFVFPKVVFAVQRNAIESRTFDSSRFVIGYVILWHAILSRFEIAVETLVPELKNVSRLWVTGDRC